MLMPAATPAYDRRTIALHWLTAFLVVTLWSLGQTIDWFSKGTPRVAARSTHILVGTFLACVICYRATWRLTSGRRLPPADSGWLQTIADLTHVGLYLLPFTTVALGIANAWIRGDSIFDLFRIPSLAPDDKAMRGSVENLHGLAANSLIVLAAMHATAGLTHHFIWKDGVLHRMIPGIGKR